MQSWRGSKVALSAQVVGEDAATATATAPCLVYCICMEDGENRLSVAMNDELHEGLDRVERDLGQRPPTLPATLLLTGAGKYFSVGLDLASYAADSAPQACFHHSYQRLLARLLAFPVVTVAAMNGHAIAGGLVLALACDFRVMDGRRGLIAMNEIHLPSSIPRGMLSLVQAKVTGAALQRDMLILGRRFTSAQAHEQGVVDFLTGEEAPVVRDLATAVAVARAHPIRKTPFLRLIKEIQYRQALADLQELETFDHLRFAAATLSKQ